jgi:hypothetical protein
MSVHSQISTLLHKFIQSVLCYLGMRIPVKIPERILFIECLASNATPLDVTLGLMFLNTQTFDVEPLSALVLALDHERILVGYTVAANTILFGVIYLYQFGWDFT